MITQDAPRQPIARKYRNKKVAIDGLTFDSQAEGRRYLELKALQKSGYIDQLQCHVSFQLAPAVKLAGKKRASPPIRFIADFVYRQDGGQVVEDVKGLLTTAYKIKRHLMKAIHGIDIVEVRK